MNPEHVRAAFLDELDKIASHRVVAGVKHAGVLGKVRDVLHNSQSRDNLTELAGLGVLAVPGADTLQSHLRARMAGDKSPGGAEKRRLIGDAGHAGADVAGLGMLMAPELKHLIQRHGHG